MTWGRVLAWLHRLRLSFFGDPAGFIDALPEPWRSIGLAELTAATWASTPFHARLRPHWRQVESDADSVVIAFSAAGDFLGSTDAGPGRPGLLRLRAPADRLEAHTYGKTPAKVHTAIWNGWAVYRRARRAGVSRAQALQATWRPAWPRPVPGGPAAFEGPSPEVYRWWRQRNPRPAPRIEGPGGPQFVVSAPDMATTLASLAAQTWPHWRLAREAPTPSGAIVLSLAPGDELEPDALAAMAAVFADPAVAAVYTDEDHLDERGRPAGPVFKPAFDTERLKLQDYIGGAIARRADGTGATVRHLPRVLWRRARAPEWPIAQIPRPLPEPRPQVLAVVPTRDQADLVRACAAGLLERTDYAQLEVRIVDNGSADTGAVRELEALGARPGVRVMRVDAPFNYAALNNDAVAGSEAEVLAFLNDDTLVIEPQWLAEMVALAVRPDVGAVGAKLFYPDGRIQHGGVVLGLGPLRVAGHALRGAPGNLAGPQGMLNVVREVSAVTAACLVIERSKFEAVGGFDLDFPVAFNDVDLCLRLNARGWKTLWTPHARMVHLESASRSAEPSGARVARLQADAARMRERWGELLDRDPYFHPALAGERFAVAYTPRDFDAR